MHKFLIIILIAIFLLPAFTEEVYTFNQKDIDKFFSFADAYIQLAKQHVKSSEDLSIEDLYYNDSETLLDASEAFLKKYGWDYLKMNDFLYIIRITLDYIGLIDAYGDILGDEMKDLGEGISEDMLALVRKNFGKLTKYFRIIDYSDYEDEPVDYEEEGYPDIPIEDIIPPVSDVTGTWYLESDESFVWNFKKDGTVTVGQITPMAADVGSWKGTYKFEDAVLTFKLDKPHPFPNKFNVNGAKLSGDDDSLVR